MWKAAFVIERKAKRTTLLLLILLYIHTSHDTLRGAKAWMVIKAGKMKKWSMSSPPSKNLKMHTLYIALENYKNTDRVFLLL